MQALGREAIGGLTTLSVEHEVAEDEYPASARDQRLQGVPVRGVEVGRVEARLREAPPDRAVDGVGGRRDMPEAILGEWLIGREEEVPVRIRQSGVLEE